MQINAALIVREHHAGMTLPICPNCAQPMSFLRDIPGAEGMRHIKTYQCKPCGIVFSQGDEGDRTPARSEGRDVCAP
jgi:hypothetical protein